jgi:radical SAM superfamily enzyme with C-terminal helix-hairpin-helix motif
MQRLLRYPHPTMQAKIRSTIRSTTRAFAAILVVGVLALPAQAPPLLDLNTASASQLAALPGMGSVYARRILDGRPYTAKNQLVTRGILPRDAYEQIKERIIAHRVHRS